MPDSSDKANERWWAGFIHGERHPSQGTAHPDVSSVGFTLEHKYRLLSQYSAEFRKAINQHDINRELFPYKIPLIGLTFHGERGQNARRFLIVEVFNKDKTMDTVLKRLLETYYKE